MPLRLTPDRWFEFKFGARRCHLTGSAFSFSVRALSSYVLRVHVRLFSSSEASRARVAERPGRLDVCQFPCGAPVTSCAISSVTRAFWSFGQP